MNTKHVEILRCLECSSGIAVGEVIDGDGAVMESGVLRCQDCGAEYPVVDHVPVMFRRNAFGTLANAQERAFAREHGVNCLDECDHHAEVKGKSDVSRKWSFQWTTVKREEQRLKGIFLSREHRTSELIRVFREDEVAGNACLRLGCGTGYVDHERVASCGLYVAVDIADGVRLTEKECRGVDHALVLKCDIDALPLAEGRFDAVESTGVLHHLPDMYATIRYVTRFLAPGGRLHFTVYKYNRIMDFLVEPAKRVVLRRFGTRGLLACSWLLAALAWPVCKAYRALQLWGPRRLFRSLPMNEHLAYWGTGNLRTLSWVFFDLLHARYAVYTRPGEMVSFLEGLAPSCATSVKVVQDAWILAKLQRL